jgi:hypothetical protein
MPANERIVLSADELRFLGKLFKKVLGNRELKKTSYIPEKFFEKFPGRKISFKVLERCYNQDETIYTESDIDIDSDTDFTIASVDQTKGSKIMSSMNYMTQEEQASLEKILNNQKEHNAKINNYRKHPEFYNDTKALDIFINMFPARKSLTFKQLKNMLTQSKSRTQIQTIQPSRRHSYSDEENRAIMEAYKNSFLIDANQNLNLVLTLARNNFKNLNKNLNIRNLRSHIAELRRMPDYEQFFIEAQSNAILTKMELNNKSRAGSQNEDAEVKRKRILSQNSSNLIPVNTAINIVNEMEGKLRTFPLITINISYMRELLNQRPIRIEHAEPFDSFCRNLRLEIQNIPAKGLFLINALRHYLANVYDLKYSVSEIKDSIRNVSFLMRNYIQEKFNIGINELLSIVSEYFNGKTTPFFEINILKIFEVFYDFKIVIYEEISFEENALTFCGEPDAKYKNIMILYKKYQSYSMLYSDRIDTRYTISFDGNFILCNRNSEIFITRREDVSNHNQQRHTSKLTSAISIDEEYISNSISRMSIDVSPIKSKPKTKQTREERAVIDSCSEIEIDANENDSVFDDPVNITVPIEDIINMAKNYDSQPIFDSICYNCGQLLFGKTGRGCKQLAAPTVIEEDIQLKRMFIKNPVPIEIYTNQKRGRCYGRYFSCPKCRSGPTSSIKNQFSVGSPESNCYDIPDVLRRVNDFRDRQLLSLCNIESYFNRPSKHSAKLNGTTDRYNKCYE